MRFLPCLLGFSVAFGASLRAEAGDVAPADSPRPANRPPKFLPGARVEPRLANDLVPSGVGVRAGRRLSLVVSAEDPDGDPIVYRVRNPPAGASFDAETGTLTWTPAPEQIGKYDIVFEASDGRAQATRQTTLYVQANRAPSASAERRLFFVAATRSAGPADGYPQSVARDDDSDPLMFSVRKLPQGARLRAVDQALTIVWSPTPDDVGEHELVVVVSDGELVTTVERELVVLPEWATSDYRGWFLLGGGASGFLSHDDGETFVGGVVDATLVALTEDGRAGVQCADGTRHRDCHASHHRFYGQFEVLDSLRERRASLFTYAFGYSASFEYYPGRRFLIPHYGIELGGLVRDELGHRVQTRPYLGLHVWADRHVWLGATLGYRVVPAELDTLSGPTASLLATLNPW